MQTDILVTSNRTESDEASVSARNRGDLRIEYSHGSVESDSRRRGGRESLLGLVAL